MQLTFILKTRAADCTIPQLMTSIDRKSRDFEDHDWICLCIVKEQCSDEEESQ
jgi:hypothetical protein